MNVETKFLNKEAVLEWMNFLVRQGDVAEAPGITMVQISEEFTKLCRAFYYKGDIPRESALSIYENLSPDEKQLRRALDRLLDLKMKNVNGPTYWFITPRQWLCVYKVFQFLHLIGDGHGCMAQMERMIAHIYQGDVPRVPCRQDDISKKNSVKPFNTPLRAWEQKERNTNMEFYWQTAIRLLQFIKEECGNKCGFSAEVPK